MPPYKVTLTDTECRELQQRIQKGRKGIKHVQILMKLDEKPKNAAWTYDRIKATYGATHSTISGVPKRFVFEGIDAAHLTPELS